MTGKPALATAALIVLPGAELVLLYQICFDVWMTAYIQSGVEVWRDRLYVHLAVSVVLGALWSGTLFWLLHRKRLAKTDSELQVN